MTEEIYNKATNLRSLIEKEKKTLKYWKEAVDATEETITLSNGLGYNGYVKKNIYFYVYVFQRIERHGYRETYKESRKSSKNV